VSHRSLIVGKLVDDNQSRLDALLQRILMEPEPVGSPTASEGPRQGELTACSAASSSSQHWQSAHCCWWSDWEPTAGREQWWERSETSDWRFSYGGGQQYPSAEERQAQTAREAEAKQKAKAEKRLRQRAKKVEANIDPTDFKLGQVHLGDIRTAQKLWQIFRMMKTLRIRS
ncbi:MAG: hypothetical protein ACKPKO_06795, partial [Candidatus Fonsibacter sp.]